MLQDLEERGTFKQIRLHFYNRYLDDNIFMAAPRNIIDHIL